jgi:hypothetical protein
MARTIETFFAYWDAEKKILVKVPQPSYDSKLRFDINGYPVYGITKDGLPRKVREYGVIPGCDPKPFGGIESKKEFIKK